MKVFIAGARGGIGSVISKLFTDNGISVVAPTSDELDLGATFTVPTEEFDGLVYCAGVNYLRKYNELDYEEFSRLMNINTISFIRLCSDMNLTSGANIVAIGSLYADSTKEHRIQYATSKHAMLGVVRTLALEMASKRIKINMVSPGFVNTPMTRKNNTPERIDALNQMIPLGMVSSTNLAELCYWLTTKNEYITGQNIKMDGGYSLKGI
jgi:3-oxoacyl-[acyl-carrier protein] reductase